MHERPGANATLDYKKGHVAHAHPLASAEVSAKQSDLIGKSHCDWPITPTIASQPSTRPITLGRNGILFAGSHVTAQNAYILTAGHLQVA